jgi:prepilin-type N-terminal cleavage/methylation domain-containing protein
MKFFKITPQPLLREQGFTLLEITIVTALLSAAMLITVVSYTSIARLQQKGVVARSVQQNGRYALEAMTRDIRNAAAVTVPTGNTSVSLTASFGDGGTVLYTWNQANAQLNRQSCIPDNSGNPVCTTTVASSADVRVTAMNIQYLAPPGGIAFIQIDMTVEQKAVGLPIYDPYSGSYKLTTTVSPRTF